MWFDGVERHAGWLQGIRVGAPDTRHAGMRYINYCHIDSRKDGKSLSRGGRPWARHGRGPRCEAHGYHNRLVQILVSVPGKGARPGIGFPRGHEKREAEASRKN